VFPNPCLYDATNSCGENIRLAKLFLALIQAHETPCVLVQVIVSKELVVCDKIPPSPVLVSRHVLELSKRGNNRL
jgi:hypothetical protein